MDLDGYVNPRSLGNEEPQRFLHVDIFFDQELWDKYIANKDTSRRDLYTWDATALAALKGLGQLRGRGLTGQAADDALLKGVEVSGKIGHHEPCKLRVYQHPDIMALCVGLAAKTAMQEITATPVPTGTVRLQVTNTTVPARTVRLQEITDSPVRFGSWPEQTTPGADGK